MKIKYLLVDKITLDGFVGETDDMKKVFHNFEQMGEWGKEQEQNLNIKLMLVDNDIDAFSSVGRYFCLTSLTKDENKASMHLVDSTINNESYWQRLAEQTYPNFTIEFMNVYRAALLSSSIPEQDSFVLSTNPLYLEMP